MAKASLTRGIPARVRDCPAGRSIGRPACALQLAGLVLRGLHSKSQCRAQSDVVDVAARYVDPGRAVTLIVGDYQAIEASLPSLGLGEPQLLPADE